MSVRPPRLVVLGKLSVPFPLSVHAQLYAQFGTIAKQCERVDLVCLSDGPSGHSEIDGNIHVHAAPNTPGWRGHVSYIRHALRTARHLDRIARPDVYWLSDPLDSSFAGWYARYWRGAPVVPHIQADYFHVASEQFSPFARAAMATLTTLSARSGTVVRVLTQDMRQQLERRGVKPDRVVVIPPRVDFALFDPALHEAAGLQLRRQWGWGDKRVVLFAGQMWLPKGPDLLLQAAINLQDELPELCLVMLGDGPLLANLRNSVAAAGMADRILLPGKVPFVEMPMYYAAADLCAVPSRDEGFGRGAIQAAAMQRPSMVTRIGGNLEVLVDGSTGWMAEPTIEGLEQGLRQIAALPTAELAEAGQRAYGYAKPRFDAGPNIQAMIEQLIWRVATEHARPPV